MKAYLAEIEELIQGDTPREKYEWLKNLIAENNRAKGRLDFCERQFKIIQENPSTDPYTRGYISSIIKVFSTPI